MGTGIADGVCYAGVGTGAGRVRQMIFGGLGSKGI